jgi:hypothetical protein
MTEIQKPYCLAMVLCDAVHRDAATGKFTLLGTFNRLHSATWPCQSRFCVYFCVTDAIGTIPIGLRFIDSDALLSDDDIKPIAEFTGEIQFPDPLAVVEGVLGIEVQFPKAGMYHCELFAGDEVLLSRRLAVMPPPGETDE